MPTASVLSSSSPALEGAREHPSPTAPPYRVVLAAGRPAMDLQPEEAATISKLRAAASSVAAILRASFDAEDALDEADARLSPKLGALAAASDAVAPLRVQAMAAKALDARINRAVTPAASLLRSFSLVESLQRRLLRLDGSWRGGRGGLQGLLEYVDCVDRLDAAVGAVTAGCEPAVQKLQEAVEFLGRTKAAEGRRVRRLREAVAAIGELYQGEVEGMRYEGVLDEALLCLQDEYEGLLLQLRHDLGESEQVEGGDGGRRELGSETELAVLRRISETLARNDCLDICIDIFVKVRYQAAAKALLKLNPSYLKTYAPEAIDAMEWEHLEAAIALWLDHLELAIGAVLASEKRLCSHVLAGVMDGAVWPECFAKVADKIMAVFFRFGEGVARSAKEPHKLLKFLDMLAGTERLHPGIAQTFDGDAGADIYRRFRELQKLLVHAAAKAFWEFGLRIEGGLDGGPPQSDGSVPGVVRYTVNYLKCLAADGYSAPLAKVLQTEQAWKGTGAGAGETPDSPAREEILRDAIASIMEALCRNVEAKRSHSEDRVLSCVLAMNTYWYMYMRTRGSDLGRLLGEKVLKRKYKVVAEEAAYSYQVQAWRPLVRLLEEEEEEEGGKDGREAARRALAARRKMAAFKAEFEGAVQRHRVCYRIPDGDLREQVGEAVMRLVVPAYERFLGSCSSLLPERSVLPPESIKRLLRQVFHDRDLELG
ncbi:hypothetical protein Taro_015230 [Colocasia esculenta]|uniref:Exocyst subunit Exo70 family protein n=1 Tax=Colocasia esculenta TaxID=4460 RepID=A0A843ULT6_COLES|nr:hypothetical protein [Colocasia esculenta]